MSDIQIVLTKVKEDKKGEKLEKMHTLKKKKTIIVCSKLENVFILRHNLWV